MFWVLGFDVISLFSIHAEIYKQEQAAAKQRAAAEPYQMGSKFLILCGYIAYHLCLDLIP